MLSSCKTLSLVIETGKGQFTEGLVFSAKDLGLHPGRNVTYAPERPCFKACNDLVAKWKTEWNVPG